MSNYLARVLNGYQVVSELPDGRFDISPVYKYKDAAMTVMRKRVRLRSSLLQFYAPTVKKTQEAAV